MHSPWDDGRPDAPATEATCRVAAVCRSDAAGRAVPKFPQPEVLVTRHGVPRDAGCAAVGIGPLAAGSLGENLLVEGGGDLSDLGPGDEIHVGGDGAAGAAVVLAVTEQNRPCSNLKRWHPDLPRTLLGRRGVICVVRREGVARPGDPVRILRTPRQQPSGLR